MIVKIQGGLGNQMFGYAFAKALAMRFDVDVGLDIYTAYKDLKNRPAIIASHHTHIRNVELLNFNITLQTLDKRSLEAFYARHDWLFRVVNANILHNVFYAILRCFIPYRYKKKGSSYRHIITDANVLTQYFVESGVKDSKRISDKNDSGGGGGRREEGAIKARPKYHKNTPWQHKKKLDPQNSLINPASYFQGYFQNLAYFDSIRETLLNDFTLKTPLDSKNIATKNHILGTKDSVSLHIRRGDYLQFEWLFINLGSSYYNGALRALRRRVSVPHIFVFSNDIMWCKKHLVQNLDPALTQGLHFEFIDNNDEGSVSLDFELMRSCKHNIIANSTFSWWAAYLNENPSRVIIVPSKFLTSVPTEVFENYEGKIYKDEWVKVDYVWGKEVQV